jgi:hypothetical protein
MGTALPALVFRFPTSGCSFAARCRFEVRRFAVIYLRGNCVPATGKGRIKTRRYSRVDLAGDDDGGGTSGHHTSERPRQTERGGSISA